MPALGFDFRIHTLSEKSKNPPQYIFAGDKSFRQLSAMPLPCFVQNKFFAHWPKEIENFAKFQTTVSSNCSCGHVERNFDIFAKYYPGGRTFFVLCPNMLKDKPFLFRKFFSNGSSRQVESSFVKPAEKNCGNDQVFFAQFPLFRKISFFSMENGFLKIPFGTSR